MLSLGRISRAAAVAPRWPVAPILGNGRAALSLGGPRSVRFINYSHEQIPQQFVPKHLRPRARPGIMPRRVDPPKPMPKFQEDVKLTTFQEMFTPQMPPREFRPFVRWVTLLSGPFFAFAIGSFVYGLYSVSRDVGDILMAFQSANAGPFLVNKNLSSLVEFVVTNDALKFVLARSDEYMERLFFLVDHGDEVETRTNASKVLDYMSTNPEVARIMLAKGYEARLVAVANNEGHSLLIRKSAGMALANLCVRVEEPENRRHLAMSGAIDALHNVGEVHALKRRHMERALLLMCAAAFDPATGLVDPFVAERNPLVGAEGIRAQALAYEAQHSSFLFHYKNTLVETGMILYLHTAAGGAVWGLAEALRQRMPPRLVLRHTLMTSLVTCLVPMIFVGGAMTFFNKERKKKNTPHEIFDFHAKAFMCMFPVWVLLPIVEAASPFWIGGHVVGFTSFFFYLYWTEADVFKSDNQIAYKEFQQELRTRLGNKAKRQDFIDRALPPEDYSQLDRPLDAPDIMDTSRFSARWQKTHPLVVPSREGGGGDAEPA